MARKKDVYTQLIEMLFAKFYDGKSVEFTFDRANLQPIADELGIKLPKNLGDVVYSFRYRKDLPESIRKTTPPGYEWIIRPAGRGRYKFSLVPETRIVASPILAETKILDSTPGPIRKYALSDEQSLLAKLRYNRLIDIFTGLTCYSLQNHLRTTVPGLGQVETDEIYIGVDARGAQYIIPVQAKGRNDRIGVVQIEQDFALCAAKFPQLICRPIASQFSNNELIIMFEFVQTDQGLRAVRERHYRLVHPADLSAEELAAYHRDTL